MQSTGGFSMDPDLLACRKKVRGLIYQSIMNGRFSNQNPNTDGWKPRAGDITKKLEELVFKEAASKEDYMSLTQSRIEQQILHIMKTLRGNSQQSSHRISSSSNMNTMMPTPGMAHGGSGIHSVSADNTTMNNTNVASSLVQNTNANVSVGAANNSMFTANGTNNLHGYRQTPSNVIHGTGGNSNTMQRSGLSHELSQMIPTPGLSSNNNNNNYNSNPMSSNSDLSSHGQTGGFSNIDTVMVPQQQKQQQYVPSQNSRMLQGFGSQRGAAMRSNMQQNIPTFGLSNVVSNGSSIGLTGSSSSMPAVNRLETQDVYSNNASYATFNRQQLQQNIQTPSSQHQLLPMAGHGYSGSNMYGSGSSFVSTVNNNNQRMNSMNLHAKQKTNHAVPTHHNSSMQQQQQPSLIKPQFDSSQQHMNLQTSQTQEYQMNPQNQMQNVQHQPFQQPLEPTNHERSVQKQQQQQQQYVQNQQQLIPKTELLRQNSTTNFGGRSIQDHRHHQSVESFKESLVSQPPQQLHLSESENQFQHINNNDDNIGTNLFNDNTQFSGSQDFQTSYSHGSQYLLPEQPLAIDSQNEFSSLMNASQSDAFNQQNWQPQMRHQNDSTGDINFLCDQQQQFHGVTNGHIEVQKQPQSLASSDVAHVSASQADAVPPHSSSGNEDLKSKKQKAWLLYLLHSYKCSGACKYDGCMEIHKLWVHMDKCKPEQQCKMPKCIQSKALINHFNHCSLEACPVCIPVKKFAAIHRIPLVIKKIESGKPINMEITTTNRNDAPSVEPNSIDVPPPSPKRMKTQQSLPSLVPKRETSPIPSYMNLHSNALLDGDIQIPQQSGLIPRFKPEPSVEVKINPLSGGHHTNFGDQIKKDNSTNPKNIQIRHAASAEPLLVADEHDSRVKQEIFLVEKDKNKLVKVETKQEVNVASHPDPISGSKSGKPKVKGVSMTELFTPEQINDHIISLRKWVGQSKAKVEKNQALERSMTENSCQLCAAEKLTFDPPPIYCTPCGARIKRNAMYYTIGSGDTRHYFCIPCYNEARGDSIQVDGTAYPKARLEKKKNDEETEEWWVQCDKCEAWQHQICALFNGRRNDGGQAEYTCPNCYVLEVKNGERKPLPQSAVLGAKDLPRTILSDHIEQRLFRRLKQEKQERARHLGKSIDEISGADSLVVRVVSSVDKKLEVKQRFLEIFQEENYPAEFPYKSKVVLLFQNIEGVEVCLFGMYVQEFGSECQFPNQRRVYLSYLDSVKYFRPDIKTVTGEALRTFVYHEILIAYLEYCKKRGFTSCYIWACPPLKGEDYILYCHPEIQKTPKSDKLREWYLAMLRKAAKENIVVELTNLYDHFFTTTGECKAKVTAARLPYFDGDYWPGAAEDMINQLRLEEDGRKLQKKGKTKKLITKRALKAAGQIDISGNASKDALLMQKLGETIYPMKEDFIMVHLQHSCTHCCLLMVSGTRWVCNKCKNFQLCEKCYDTEQRLDVRERHPINSRDKHDLCPVEITDVSPDTKDKDEILESEFFDTRQAFLSLCQGNHYQYDTLRRAKHSSMMMLYHLHNPTAPAFVTTCNVCLRDVEAGQGWRCEECPEFDVCNACYKKDGGIDHPHPLTNYPTTSERDAQNQEARQQRVVQLRKMLELLVHASQCRYPSCQYPNCRKVKGLFRHGINCKIRASGGCLLCKKMWYLLQLHARACKESECHVPRCKDLKDHLRRLQQQSDSRRRAAVMEMMRQRHAEVAGGND